MEKGLKRKKVQSPNSIAVPLDNYFIVDTKSHNIFDYQKKSKALYNSIDRTGYRVFSLSEKTKLLLQKHDTKKIKNILILKQHFKKLIHRYDYKKDEVEYSSCRYHATWHTLELFKSEFENFPEIINIVESILDDIKTIFDLKDWLSITINFLISYSKRNNKKTGSDKQEFHMDYKLIEKDSIFKKKGEQSYPFSIIVTLEEFSYFRLLCNSHKIIEEAADLTIDSSTFHEKILKLEFGQFIIFHPNLIHSGFN